MLGGGLVQVIVLFFEKSREVIIGRRHGERAAVLNGATKDGASGAWSMRIHQHHPIGRHWCGEGHDFFSDFLHPCGHGMKAKGDIRSQLFGVRRNRKPQGVCQQTQCRGGITASTS